MPSRAGRGAGAGSGGTPPDPAALAAAARAADAFGADVYRLLGAAGGNLVFSPASIAAALQMALSGARGTTSDQLARALHLGTAPEPGEGVRALAAVIGGLTAGTPDVTVRGPVTVWTQAGLPVSPEFTETLGTLAGAVRSLDFAGAADRARAEINAVIAEQTAGRITGLLAPGTIDATARLVLASAMYLKAAWEHPFPPGATADAPFHPVPGTDVGVPMMRVAARLRYLRGDGYQVVTLPYLGGRLGMAVVLPDGPLAPLEDRLTGGVGALLAGAETAQVRLGLPRFRHTAAFGLTPTLAALGVADALGGAADFTGITPAGGLFLSEVAHQAFIDVDERGTEAAAATGAAVAFAAYTRPDRTVEMVVDRPFLFAITDTGTGLPLFLGRVTDPTGVTTPGLGH